MLDAQDQNPELDADGKPIVLKDQQGTGDQGDSKEPNEDATVFADAKKAEAEIKRLRAENAKHRNKNKELEAKYSSMDGTLASIKKKLGIEDGESDPAQELEALKEQSHVYQAELAIRDLAMEHAVPASNMKYFKFLLNEKFEALEEGDELAEDELLDAITQAKAYSIPNDKKKTATGLNNNANPNPDAKDTVTLGEFVKMDLSQKSFLYQRDPTTYTKLFNEAREKKFI